jgi:hypothetical protein
MRPASADRAKRGLSLPARNDAPVGVDKQRDDH